MLAKGEIPFVRLLVPLVAGLVAAMQWPGKELLEWSVIGLLIGMALFIVLILLYKVYLLYRWKWIFGILIHVIVLLTGCILTLRAAEKYDPDYFLKYKSQALIVTVKDEPKVSGNIIRFEAAVEQSISSGTSLPVSGSLLVAIKTDSLNPMQLNYGNKLIIPSSFREVDPPFNPAEFDYKAYLGTKQLYMQSFINQQQVTLLNHHSGNILIAFAFGLRKQLVEKLYKYLANKDAADLASTLILGYRANLSKEVVSAYSRTGTLHILSVSGMHVAIVFMVLAFVMTPLSKHRKLRFLSAFIIISAILFYALMTGFSPSACRAAMMLSFVVMGKTLNKNQNTYNLLAISAFFLLIYNPYYLVDVGFQLSYLAVIGLVFLHSKIYYLLYFKNKLVDSIWSYSSLSMAAQLATFPVSLYYFHQFPVYFLISNLLVVLPVALIMYAGILFLFIPWPALLNPLGDFLNGLITRTNDVLFYIEDLPYASAEGIWINIYQYILIYLIIASFIWASISAKKAGIYYCLGCALLLSLSISIKIVRDSSRNELIFYSLRKNSALAYIRHGKAYLISDLFHDEKTFQYSIKPALQSRGVPIVKYLNINNTYSEQDLKVNPDHLQFGDFRVLRWTKKMDDLTFGRRIKTNVILLSGNPLVKVKELRENVDFSMLLIDATNPEYKIMKWRNDATGLKIPVKVLKKSPAYTLNPDLAKY